MQKLYCIDVIRNRKDNSVWGYVLELPNGKYVKYPKDVLKEYVRSG